MSAPIPTAKTRLPSINRTQSRVFTGILTGYNTPERHHYIIGLIDSPLNVGGVEQRMKHQSMICVSVKHWL